ncbi:DnaB-like helicase N-terminal domain-containing protein [Tomitella gaofuii]|uniref:DnaB-like helicase N-terminal domain-containing protein n=1 Tax=Tomitella gaofuii TaxID=2760083 RepID=UPI0015FD4096|nr:DnaB-like helicase N-terminal domain-containing protein [Tomitella gaofuii]
MSIDELDPIPELDTEAMMLCAALWSRDHHRNAAIAALVAANDFERPAHATIYTYWCLQVATHRPHDAASLSAQLLDAGADAAPRSVHTALRAVTTLGAEPGAIGEHAVNVVTAAYRRSYLSVAESLAHAATAAPTAELFPIMVEHGRRQRAAARRLEALRQHIGAEPPYRQEDQA